ncbi:hypothetical protein [Faecalispora sporosphaeroides]|uniref:hypothetical protein n=1 Tax=Faecalispora sporosphaeroides TaxID=1549 RepID=UPI002DDB008E|nr:hypothetical protein [Faecalispora sporosphaeroides]
MDSLCSCPYFHRSATYIVKKESQKAVQSFSELLLYATLKIPYGRKMPDLPHAMFQVQQLKLIRNFYLPANAGALSPQGDGQRLQSEWCQENPSAPSAFTRRLLIELGFSPL